ncbi:MAG: hypothetical protein PF505_12840, partial [Vallitaleaceae bacterium]|nr:hypothetical protein [Vallitaleaceae bacterium]
MKCSKLVKSIRSTSDELPMGISIYDAQANLVYMNKAAVSLFELSNADDAIGFELFEDPNIPIETKEMIRLNDTFEFEIDFNFKSA